MVDIVQCHDMLFQVNAKRCEYYWYTGQSFLEKCNYLSLSVLGSATDDVNTALCTVTFSINAGF